MNVISEDLHDRLELCERELELLKKQLEIEKKNRLRLSEELRELKNERQTQLEVTPASAASILGKVMTEKKRTALIKNVAHARQVAIAEGTIGRPHKKFYDVPCNCGRGESIEGHKGPYCPKYNWLRRWGVPAAQADVDELKPSQIVESEPKTF